MQLPEEAKKFDKINKEFKSIMKTTHESPVVVRAATEKEFEALTAMGDRLDKCQKSLTDYLDTKRNAFSRFYFISDDELLSVLGSSDPTSIQVHMLKLFDNVKELKFGCRLSVEVELELELGVSRSHTGAARRRSRAWSVARRRASTCVRKT